MNRLFLLLPIFLGGCVYHQPDLCTLGGVLFGVLLAMGVLYRCLEGRWMHWKEVQLIFAVQWIGIALIIAGCGTTQYVAVPPIKQPKPVIMPCPPLLKATQDNFVAIMVRNYELYNACREQTNNVIIPYFEKVK
jgi:hypothetical protein